MQMCFMNNPIYKISVFILLLMTATAWAQDEDELSPEVINVVRPYTPSVSDAFKVKEDASLPDSIATDKKPMEYTINSVPVASTFTPAKGKATRLAVERPERIYNNYASLGFGNYTSMLAEFYSNFEISRYDDFSVFLRHNSSQGGIENVVLDDKFYDTRLNLGYKSSLRDMTYQINVEGLHQLYNWYGLPIDTFTADQAETIDPVHSFMGAAIGGAIQTEDSFFTDGDVLLRYFGDSYSSSELFAQLQPKFAFEVGRQHIGINADVSYVSGGFEQSYNNPDTDIAYSYLNLGVHPYIKLNQDRFSAVIGVAVYAGMDNEASESDVFIYPKLEASYRLSGDAAIVYAGVDGGLEQNTYYDIVQKNPFVSPTLFIAPTNKEYDAYAGLKGLVNTKLGYDLKVSYSKEEGVPLFIINPYDVMQPFDDTNEDFAYGNSFGVYYESMTTLEVFGELRYDFNNNYTVGFNASYFNYDAVAREVLNLPELTASLFAKANFTKKFYGGLDVFFVGKRKEFLANNTFFDNFNVVTLDSFVDLNINFGFNVNDQLSIFLKGNNLLGENYQRWLNYPVQGLQFMGGATYKFDW